MKTLSLVLTAALSAFGLVACGDDTGGGTTGSGGSSGTGDGGSSANGNGGENSTPSSSGSNSPTGSTSGSNNTSSSGEGGDNNAVVGTGQGGSGGGIDCGEDPFLCDDTCIPADWECDGVPDCVDETDEYPVNVDCPVFTCEDGEVWPAAYECDGFADCTDETDEYPVNPNCDPPPEVPEGWICDPAFYADGYCDCGCAVLDDLDCVDATSDSCEFCEDGCDAENGDADCATIDPANNAVCI